MTIAKQSLKYVWQCRITSRAFTKQTKRVVEVNYVRLSRYDSKPKRTVINFLMWSSSHWENIWVWFYFMEKFGRILELQLDFMQKDFHKRRAPYHRTITAAVQRIADTGNIMPKYAGAGTSTVVARCVANSFNETSQFPRKLWMSEKNLFETFWTSRSKVLTDSFCCSGYIPPCIMIYFHFYSELYFGKQQIIAFFDNSKFEIAILIVRILWFLVLFLNFRRKTRLIK